MDSRNPLPVVGLVGGIVTSGPFGFGVCAGGVGVSELDSLVGGVVAVAYSGRTKRPVNDLCCIMKPYSSDTFATRNTYSFARFGGLFFPLQHHRQKTIDFLTHFLNETNKTCSSLLCTVPFCPSPMPAEMSLYVQDVEYMLPGLASNTYCVPIHRVEWWVMAGALNENPEAIPLAWPSQYLVLPPTHRQQIHARQILDTHVLGCTAHGTNDDGYVSTGSESPVLIQYRARH